MTTGPVSADPGPAVVRAGVLRRRTAVRRMAMPVVVPIVIGLPRRFPVVHRAVDVARTGSHAGEHRGHR